VPFEVSDWPNLKFTPLELLGLSYTHTAQLLPVYNSSGDLVMPDEYENTLPGAVVHLRFSLNRYPSSLASSFITHTFVADIERVSVMTFIYDSSAESAMQMYILQLGNVT